MLQAFIITLREGVEASLIVGIIFAYLSKIGRHELKRTVFWALGSALVASVLAAVLVARLQLNSDIFEGWVMLAAAAFVISMIWFMHKTARSMKGEIEPKSHRVTSGTSRLGLFLFVFLLVLREGVETVLILSAVSLNSTELLSFTGTVLGIAVAVVFGVLFIRGSVKINLQRFFRVTTVILYFVTFQLIVSGLHELSENGVLPSSTAEMRYIGPIVRNDLFFFVTMLALTGLMILMEQRRRTPDRPSPHTASPADRRRARLEPPPRAALDDRRRRRLLPLHLPFHRRVHLRQKLHRPLATSPVTLVGNQVTVPTADINDDQLHRFGVHVDDGRRHSPEVRFLLFKKPDGNIVAVADACSICGPVGFYIGSQGITCKMCASPLVPASMGQPGGCNPHPAPSHQQQRPDHHRRRRPQSPRPPLREVGPQMGASDPSASANRGHPFIAPLPHATSGSPSHVESGFPSSAARPLMFLRLLLESFPARSAAKPSPASPSCSAPPPSPPCSPSPPPSATASTASSPSTAPTSVVTPKAADLAVNIGGVDVQPATGGAYLHESDLAKLHTIFWANNITAVSPERSMPMTGTFCTLRSTSVRRAKHQVPYNRSLLLVQPPIR